MDGFSGIAFKMEESIKSKLIELGATSKNNAVKVLDFGLARFSRLERKTVVLEEDTFPESTDRDREEISQTQKKNVLDSVDLTQTVPRALPDGKSIISAHGIPRESFQTKHGTVMGTPLYMSPEQARGETVSAASDMYSFGLLLQQLFTGLEPYDETDEPSTILEKAMKAETRPVSGISSDLAALINRLKSPIPKC